MLGAVNVLEAIREARGSTAPAIPDGRRVYAIGDIHGRADLLDALLAKIDKDRAGADFKGKPVLVFIGDYIDRGLQSRDVIDRALATAEQGFQPIFIKGNHEAALLTFLDRPETGTGWFTLGGAETLFSYGVRAPNPGAPLTELRFASRALRAAMPHAHLRFFARLQLHAKVGDYLFVHAGLRPGEPLEKQTETDMLEIRQPFLKSRKRWPFVVVHGHTPIDSVTKDQRRIAIDTGAYATGKLSAIRLQGTLMEVITT